MKTKLIFAVVGLVFVSGVGAVEGERSPAGDAAERAEMGRLILAKSFCVGLRRNHGAESLERLKKYIDPVYLKENGLMEGDLAMETLPVDGIHDIQVGEDGDTIVCLLNTDEGKKEVLVLAAVERGGELYFSPVGAPEEGAGRFSPWVLRMEVGEKG